MLGGSFLAKSISKFESEAEVWRSDLSDLGISIGLSADGICCVGLVRLA